MQKRDPRWSKFWLNLIWFVVTLTALVILLRISRSPVTLIALWGVAIVWGAILAAKFSRLIFGIDQIGAVEERSRIHLEQAYDYKTKISDVIKSVSMASSHVDPEQLTRQINILVDAIDDLVARISDLRYNEVIHRDLQAVPQAINDLEKQIALENDGAIRTQLDRTLSNRRKQLESLKALQNTIRRAEIQIESTLSQLGTIYSQILTGQSTSQVADYSRLAADVDEEVKLLQDHLSALREVKLGER